MRVRRDISSVPSRTANDTWWKIVELTTGKDSVDAGQLSAALGVMGSIITDGHPAKRAIILEGVGPQLKIYCAYGTDAVEAGDHVDALTWNPTAGNWTMHVPCDAENMDWVKKSLAKTSPRIKVFDVDEEERIETQGAFVPQSAGLEVDWNIKE